MEGLAPKVTARTRREAPFDGAIACEPLRLPRRVVEPERLPRLPPSVLSDPEVVLYPYAFLVPSITSVEQRVAILNSLVRQDLCDPDLQRMAKECAARTDGTPRGIAQAILDLQNEKIAYVLDPGRSEVFQSARYSLARRAGDCEDKGVFFATLAILAGLRAAVCWLNQPPPARNNHVAPKVCLSWLRGAPASYVPAIWDYSERRGEHTLEVTCPTGLEEGVWVWAETTLRGARVGEHPYDALARLGTQSEARHNL